MEQPPIYVSAELRRKGTKAMLTILVFILTYLLLVTGVAVLTYFAVQFSILMMIAAPSLPTAVLALAIVAACAIVCFFMVKFIFSRQKTDRSLLLKVTRSDEPRLFALIDEIVTHAQCKFPKSVYISSDVNACVFYDSSFWSMFLPVRKNLMIGAGMINSVTEDEFKVILAHEFGHFAQKSMKIGSYVYNSNRVLFNLMYDNRSLDSLNDNLRHLGIVGQALAYTGTGIIRGIRWILLQVYKLVNIQYLSLSRDMEFQADAFAARIAGKQPLIDSLLRTGLSEHAFKNVLAFYNECIGDSIRTEDIYPQHAFVLHFLAEKNQIARVNDLPHITEERVQQFNKSLLKISNQWESHPANEERIASLASIGDRAYAGNGPAASIFTDFAQTGKAVTKRLFASVPPQGVVEMIDLETFRHAFANDYDKYSFNALFKGYYNAYDPVEKSSVELMAGDDAAETAETLFSESIEDRMQRFNALEQDRETILQIAGKQVPVRIFEYAGTQYKRKDAKHLAEQLLGRIEREKAFFAGHDGKIFRLLVRAANARGTLFIPTWERYLAFIADTRKKGETAQTLVDGMKFLQLELSAEEIIRRVKVVKPYEQLYKEAVKDILDNPQYAIALKPEARKCFTTLLEKEFHYFYNNQYAQGEIQALSDSIYWLEATLNHALFCNKKELLEVQAEILQH